MNHIIGSDHNVKNIIFLSEYITMMLDLLALMGMHFKLKASSGTSCREKVSSSRFIDWQDNWGLMRRITMPCKFISNYLIRGAALQRYSATFTLVDSLFFLALMMSFIITVGSRSQFHSLTSTRGVLWALTWYINQIGSSCHLNK